MGNSRLRDPLRRPAFRRLAASYAINEMGDWLGLVALSLLVFEATESALATALLFLGTGFLPALLTPVLVARLERPPPRSCCRRSTRPRRRLSRPGPALRELLPGGRRRPRRGRRRSGADGENPDPGRHRGDARAGGRAARRQRDPQLRLHRRRRRRPGRGRRRRRRLGVQPALLLDAVSFYAIAWIVLRRSRCPRPSRSRATCASSCAPGSTTSAATAPWPACSSPRRWS